MLSIIYSNCHDSRSRELAVKLRRYGIKDIIECKSTSIPNIPAKEEDTILVNSHYDISTTAIRQITFRTARLPKALVVWDNDDHQEVVIMKVPSSLLQENLKKHHSLLSAVHDLARNKTLSPTTYHALTSNSASCVGGSFSDSGLHQYFAKVADARGAKKLQDEIRMYESLPPELEDYYPRLVFSTEKKGVVSMGTHYENFPNLRDLLLNGHLSTAEVAAILERVLDFEYNQAFRKYEQPSPPGYLHDYHYQRAWRRLTMSAEIDPIFGPLIAAPWLEINGRKVASVPAMLHRLENDEEVAKRLDPGRISPYIHADLHPGNILYDMENERFWLVDPRGYPACDIYYDLGKLTQSTQSCYDLIHEGRHEVTHSVEGDTAMINFDFLSPSLREQYRDLNNRLQPIIRRVLGAEAEDKDVDLRIQFNQAMHYCSLMPFHIHKDAQPSLAVPIFATGAARLADVMELLGISMEECARHHAAGMERLSNMGHAGWKFDG